MLLALRPGDTAVLTLDWSNWCVPGARQVKGKLIPPSAVRVTLASGAGSLDVPYNAVTPCTRPGAPSTIGVHPFQPPGLPNKHPWTRAIFAGKIFTVAGGPGPLHGVRGGVLRYAVRLRNESRTTVRFANCPLIAEELAPRGSVEAHQLNCAGGARRVAPGGSIRFEMRLRIPVSAPTGVNGLFWVLDPLGGQNAETVAARDRHCVVTAPRAAAAVTLAIAATAAGGWARPSTRARRRRLPPPRRRVPPYDRTQERSACNLLFARLQRVTIALQTSSDLIAHSLNKTQLSRRIAIEQVQLQRSATLMTGGPVPEALVPADRALVAALHAFARDFGRAKAPAAAGDFRAATAAMTDRPVVQRILQASTTIERACSLH